MTTGLFWFTNDLRLHDQPALWKLQSVDKLICVFCLDPQWFRPNGLNAKAMGERRLQFLVIKGSATTASACWTSTDYQATNPTSGTDRVNQ